ncbi:MAG: hypothetical protein OXF61_02890 [Acidimicrobiaceae bacterium]|nr:hypothetical protein [Acidimicrobiaceae bacterium]
MPQESGDAYEVQKLREQLEEATEEARMNWDEFMDVRDRCKALEEELATQRRDNDRLSNRLRRFRARIGDLIRARSQLADSAARINEAERLAVQALTHASVSTEPVRVSSVKQALELARTHLTALSIPESVVEAAVADLDKSGRRQARGRAVMEVLRALHAYALDPARGSDFKQWCERGGSGDACCSANRVKMHESDGVQQRERMVRARKLPVDPALDVSGRRAMPAHIRLDQGETAPRLHFLDDTQPKTGKTHTGKVHIGYIGPHLPTVRDPK